MRINNLNRLAGWALLIFTGLAGPLFGQGMVAEDDFTSAATCGACHQEIYRQWSRSMHSRSLTDPLYRTVIDVVMRQSGGKQKVFCISCHAPVAGVTGALLDLAVPVDWDAFGDVASEGVTCDFCHTISGNENLGRNISVGAYVYPRRGSTHVKYGRNPDADNENHATQVSEFLTSSEFCATCHKFMHPISGLEIQSTYEEWQRGPYRERGVRCQDCHMPVYSGRTAAQGKSREEIHAHVFSGGHTEMVRKAATLAASGRIIDGEGSARRLSVTVDVRNHGAGHAIPTGLPGLREMWLEVEVLNSNGLRIGGHSFRYGQLLVASDGSEALPWEAIAVVEDNRIGPEESAQSQFELVLPPSVGSGLRIEAKLYMRLISESLGRRLGMTLPEPVLMTSTEATIGID